MIQQFLWQEKFNNNNNNEILLLLLLFSYCSTICLPTKCLVKQLDALFGMRVFSTCYINPSTQKKSLIRKWIKHTYVFSIIKFPNLKFKNTLTYKIMILSNIQWLYKAIRVKPCRMFRRTRDKALPRCQLFSSKGIYCAGKPVENADISGF